MPSRAENYRKIIAKAATCLPAQNSCFSQLEFVKLILAHTAFQNTLKLYFDKGNVPTKGEVVEIMKSAKLYNIDSEQTYKRRASTVISWINWILELIE